MNKEIIQRYRIREKIVELNNKIYDLKKKERQLDNIITYKALLSHNKKEANKFKKNHIDTLKEGLFNQRVENGLKEGIPKEYE